MVDGRYSSGVKMAKRTWNEYRRGFGSLNGELWLGNDMIHALTDYTAQEMRIDMLNHMHFIRIFMLLMQSMHTN